MISTEQTLKMGVQFHEARRFDEARNCYRKVLRSDPAHADANHLLGLVAYQQGNHEAAIEQINRALSKRPANAQYLNSLGAACQALGRLADAQSAFERAIAVQPKYADPYNNLGTVLYSQGKFADAESIYKRALALKPEFADALLNLAAVYQALHRYDDAETNLRAALRVAPQNALAWNNLGNVHKGRERLVEAVDCYQRALAIDSKYAAAWGNLALSLQAQGEWEPAIAAFDRSLELRPAAGLMIKRALALPVILESTEQLALARRHFDDEVDRLLSSNVKIDDPHRESGVCAFHLAYHGINDRDLYCRIAAMFSKACPSLDFVSPHCRESAPLHDASRPRRVGFISHFFHNHSIGRHYGGLIRHLARDRFRAVVLRFPGADDDMSRSIDASADEVVMLSPDLATAREQIAGQRLDILYYTDIGMDPITYFLAFARLAPVQCVTNGHPVTTGIPAIDYFISCDAIEPPQAQGHYSERLVRMQNIPNYYERPRLDGPPRSRRECGLADDWHIYLCAQNLCKLHPDFDLILGEILRRDPQGRVILFHGAEKAWSERLGNRLRRSIPDVASRVGFLDHQRNNDFLHLLTLADAVLDSTHFSGGTTTAQALAVGAPVVTLPGEFMRGRITDGCYRRMGMTDCVARDAADYVQIALRLGTDPAWRLSIRQKILSRNGILYDNPGFIRELEEFFTLAARRGGAGF
jgi:predicted O-linked N-acetylglucosamine transferase (SPINDLY family)